MTGFPPRSLGLGPAGRVATIGACDPSPPLGQTAGRAPDLCSRSRLPAGGTRLRARRTAADDLGRSENRPKVRRELYPAWAGVSERPNAAAS